LKRKGRRRRRGEERRHKCLFVERRHMMGRKKNIDQDTIEYAWWSLWLLGGHKYRGVRYGRSSLMLGMISSSF
jgi:hypothetical protein